MKHLLIEGDEKLELHPLAQEALARHGAIYVSVSGNSETVWATSAKIDELAARENMTPMALMKTLLSYRTNGDGFAD